MTVNQTTHDLRTDVASYVELVRLYLGDLDDEVREELSGGLEADLLDLVADRGPGALPDPEEYADELRLAAGLPPRAASPTGPATGTGAQGLVASAAAQLRSLLEEARCRWLAWAGTGPREPAWSFVTALQPVWWVTRGWVAWMVLQDFRGPWVTYSTPQLAALALAVVGSVQLGRRRWRLGELLDRRLTARLLLVALNVFAVTMVPGAVDRTLWHAAEARAWMFYDSDPVDTDKVTYQGRQFCSLRVLDSDGNRVPGARVEDPQGYGLPLRNNQC